MSSGNIIVNISNIRWSLGELAQLLNIRFLEETTYVNEDLDELIHSHSLLIFTR